MQIRQRREIHQVRIRPGRLFWTAPLAALAAAAVNAALYALTAAFEVFPRGVRIPSSGEPMTLGAVVFSSIIGVLGAAIILAALARFVKAPIRLFRIVAFAVLVLSFATPFTIPGAPAAMVISLLMMHVVTWAVSVTLLVRLAQSQ